MHTAHRILLIFGALFAAVGPALAGESGRMLKADQLRAKPFLDAKAVGTLAPGDRVEILQKQGGWFQVKTAKGGGWVRMLSVRRGAARQSGNEVAELFGLASGRAGTGRVVATTGIRGLSEDELKAAQYNEAELQALESYAATRAEAQQFAASGKLVPRTVEYLPAPTSAP
jgi:uncharacterized protein YgiM (DUF1202 family)